MVFTVTICKMSWALFRTFWWSSPVHLSGLLCTWAVSTWPAVGTVDRRGYGGQQRGTINFVMLVGCVNRFEAHGSQFFIKFDGCCTYKSLRCLDFKLWQFFVDDNDNDRINYFTLCACTQGKENPVWNPDVYVSWCHLMPHTCTCTCMYMYMHMYAWYITFHHRWHL